MNFIKNSSKKKCEIDQKIDENSLARSNATETWNQSKHQQ